MKHPVPSVLLAGLLLAALVLAPARAQEVPPAEPPLAFELVVGIPEEGRTFRSDGLLFAQDSTLFVGSGSTFALPYPYTGPWIKRADRGIPPDRLIESRAGTIFYVSRVLFRSTDRSATWDFVLADTWGMAEVLPGGPGGPALVADTGRNLDNTIARSTDDGQTWTEVAPSDVLGRIWIRDVGYAPASEQRAVGTLVAVGLGGAAVSIDGGLTWTETNLLNVFGYQAQHVTYAPVQDLFFAGIDGPAPDGSGTQGLVWASADGETWEFRGRLPGTNRVEVIEGPDGVLWSMGRSVDDGPIYSSFDGGRTWVERGRLNGGALTGIPGNVLSPKGLAIGPEGRLWVATSGPPGPDGRGAVVRTVAPVVVSAEEPPLGKPSEAAFLGTPYPNPSAHTMTVPLVLREAAEVRVTVVDLLGREVAVLAEGIRAAGTHTLTVETAGWPSGVYVARLEANGQVATASLVVVG
ncbi:MAG: T9SS type A sorting domain-containing protein [Bacteroidota bacterium]